MPPKEYRGRLSTACEPCRARKAKCNRGKPICANCIKSGYSDQCRYRNLINMTFRNESSQTAERVNTTWKTRAKINQGTAESHEHSSSRPSTSSTLTVARRDQSERLLRTHLSFDVIDYAINRFFHDYAMPNGGPEPPFMGALDYLPQIYATAPPDSSLKEALYAVSLANFDRRTNFTIERSRLKMERHYGNALRLVAKETQDAKMVASDQLLVAVQMLAIFERMSSGGNNFVSLQAHANGLASLINVRKIPSLNDSYRWRIFQSINAQLLTSCLQLGIPSYIDYARLRKYYEDPSYSMINMMGLVHRGVNLMALWEQASVSPAERVQRADLLTQMAALDAAFDTWGTTVRQHSDFTVHSMPPISTQPSWLHPILNHPGTPQLTHHYPNVQIIHSWNMARMMRIVLSSALFQARLATPSSDPGRYKTTIQRMVQDVCRSILPLFTARIETKPDVQSVDDVCGFRAYTAEFPLHAARRALRLVEGGGVLVGRVNRIDRGEDGEQGECSEDMDNIEVRHTIAWIDTVIAVIEKYFHRMRPAR